MSRGSSPEAVGIGSVAGAANPIAAGIDFLQAGTTQMRDASAADARRGKWIVSPLFDLLFVANIFWPLVFLPSYISAEGEPYIHFWMAYYIATPHRWMTLLLATCDRDRRGTRTWQFVLMAVGVAAFVGGGRWATGSFTFLFLFYTILLAWHFASQHAGILRIYARKAGGDRRWLETWPPRIFILYASFRVIPIFEPMMQAAWLHLEVVDLIVLAIPVGMLAVELANLSRARLPKLIYMMSFCGLWSSVILAAYFDREPLWNLLLAAVTVFHSVEYLAIVTYYAWRRQTLGSAGPFQAMARNWSVVFAWWIVGCGAIYYVANTYFVVACYAVNTWASILHCGYDGMMWKLRDPATAKVLDV